MLLRATRVARVRRARGDEAPPDRMRMRVRTRWWIAAVFAVVPTLASRASAQEIDCDEKDLEVGAVHFVGNRTFTSDQLSTFVLTTPSSLYRRVFRVFGARRCYPSEGLAPDVGSLKVFYENNGFYDARIDTAVTRRSPKRVDVTFRIVEGEPIHLDTLRIEGLENVRDTAEILRDLELKVGGRFGRDLMFADMDTIVNRLRNAGYPRADRLQSYKLNKVQHRATVGIQVIPGPLTRFGAIEVSSTGVSGQPGEIDSNVVVSLLGLRAGQLYSDRAIADGQRNLYNLGTYRHVGIAIDTTYPRGDSVANLRVELREDYLRQYDQQEGWATLDCFRLNSQYTNKNFLDRAQRLELTGRLSKIGFGKPTDFSATRDLCRVHVLEKDTASSVLNYYGGVTLRRPTLFGTHWVPAYSAYSERRGEYQAYLRTTYFGGEVSASRELGRGMPFRAAYTMEYGNTVAEPAILCAVFNLCSFADRADVQKTRRLAVASGSMQWLRTNDPVEPTTGFTLAGEVRGSSRFFLSDKAIEFLKGTGNASWFRQLTRSTVFVARMSAGAISLARLLPPQERLYAGGANSVRGFGQNELGPVVYLYTRPDTNQFTADTLVTGVADSAVIFVAKPGASTGRRSPGGGNSLFVANMELRIRDPFFPELLEYVPFVDAGQVWTREPGTRQLNLQHLEITPGLGLRVFSPVGPIQANVGYYGGKTRPGPAYFAQPVDPASGQAPLVCITAPLETPVPVPLVHGQLQTTPNPCPATFVPVRKSNFFSRLTLTLSVGTAF